MSDTHDQYPFDDSETGYDVPASAEDIGSLVMDSQTALSVAAGADALGAIIGRDQLPQATIAVEDRSASGQPIEVHTRSDSFET